jgi:hypothetical protein
MAVAGAAQADRQLAAHQPEAAAGQFWAAVWSSKPGAALGCCWPKAVRDSCLPAAGRGRYRHRQDNNRGVPEIRIRWAGAGCRRCQNDGAVLFRSSIPAVTVQNPQTLCVIFRIQLQAPKKSRSQKLFQYKKDFGSKKESLI